jgi:16S rRNA (adenine1518-N6/adenine1519-N6)-dimethyltransferase
MQDLTTIKSLLAARGIRPKHRLGQNFLHDHNALRILLAAAVVEPGETILEVGPGTGTLTECLLQAGARVVACELDRDMAAIIRDRLGARVTLVQGDCLADKHHLNPNVLEALGPGPFRLVANLPYAAATPLIATLLESHPQCQGIVATIQREVADRLAAKPGTGEIGPLTVMAQLLATVERVAVLKPGSFWPPPEVTSAIVRIRPRQPRPDLPPALPGLVERAYQQRRKQLRNTLGQDFAFPGDFDPSRRPETLAPAEWIMLAQAASRSAGS